MREWLGLVKAELLKIARRKLTWVLLALLVAASALHGRSLWTELLDYRKAQVSGVGRFGQGIPPEVAQATAADLRRRMTFPYVLDEVWVITDFWGVFIVITLACLQAGEEAELGTGRTVLVRGVSRSGWPLAKLVALAATTGMFWTALAIAIVPIGLWTEAQAGGGNGLAALYGEQSAAHLGHLLRSYVATIPYLAFSVWAATLAHGAGPALVLGLGGRFVELGSTVAGAILVGMELMGESTTHAFYVVWAPLHAMTLEWSGKVLRTWGNPSWVQPLSPIPSSPVRYPLPWPFFDNPLVAILVLAGWTAVWMIWTGWSMSRRDVTA